MARYTPNPVARLQDQDTPKKRNSPTDPKEPETLAALCILVIPWKGKVEKTPKI